MLTRILRPPLTRAMKQRLATFKIPGHELHTFDGKTRPEVTIGDNSILFSTLATLFGHEKQFKRNIHSELSMVVQQHWMQLTHTDHDDNLWGQTSEEIPQFVAEILKLLYPKQKPTAAITWHQYKELLAYALRMLEAEFKVPIYHGKPVITKQDAKHYQFTVTDDAQQKSFSVTDNVFVYDWHRDFSLDNLLDPGIIHVSHTILYKFPKHKIPKTIIVLGDGESVVWLALHFPESTIYYLSRSKEKDPLAQHRKTWNKGIKINNAIKLSFLSADGSHYNDLQVAEQHRSDFPYASLVRYEDKSANIKVSGHFFACIGMRPQNYTQCLPPSQVLRLNDYLPEVIFSSTKNIPPGGLMHSFLMLMEATGNVGQAWEPNAILLGKGTQTTYMQKFLLRYGINEQHISELPGILRNLTGEKSKFSAMVTLYEHKVSSDPRKVAAFEQEIQDLYAKSRKILTPQ